MAEAIQQLIQENGLTKEAIIKTIEDMIKAAYKRKYGKSDNCLVEFEDDLSEVTVYSRKMIVDGVYDPVDEIELEDALKMSPDCEIGDEIDIAIDPKDFERSAVQTGKQIAHQSITGIQKDTLYAEYKEKVGEIMIGYFQREKNENIFLDLGKVEGILPKKNQSPRESYTKGDRIKALIVDAKKTNAGLQVVLSRGAPEFVRSLIELEVPEIADNTVEINSIVREAGYRTKVAVSSRKQDVDPVGACVGLKGVRIQAIIRELEGEKIDILRYDPDPRVFIKNALSPAEVTGVVILDEEKRQALAVVPENQFSLAIGKQGLNVRLANRLVDWNVDVKTEEQYEDIDTLMAESRKAAHDLFNDTPEYENPALVEIDGINKEIAKILADNTIVNVLEFINADESGELEKIEGITAEEIATIKDLLLQTFQFGFDEEVLDDDKESEQNVEEEEEEEEERVQDDDDDNEVEIFECPECGAEITTDMTNCPKCNIGLSFEYEDEE